MINNWNESFDPRKGNMIFCCNPETKAKREGRLSHCRPRRHIYLNYINYYIYLT